MKTLTILLVATATLSFTGIASAADTHTTPNAYSAAITQTVKVSTKRTVVRKTLSTQNHAVPTLSNKGWISVSETSRAKAKIIQPQAMKSRTPIKFGQ